MKHNTSYSRSEVNKHNVRGDCWIIVNNEVLDVTHWLQNHPGGELPILALAGVDATENFYSFHPKETASRLSRFKIGIVSKDDKQDVPSIKETIDDFSKMKEKMIKEGLFCTSYIWYLS